MVGAPENVILCLLHAYHGAAIQTGCDSDSDGGRGKICVILYQLQQNTTERRVIDQAALGSTNFCHHVSVFTCDLIS